MTGIGNIAVSSQKQGVKGQGSNGILLQVMFVTQQSSLEMQSFAPLRHPHVFVAFLFSNWFTAVFTYLNHMYRRGIGTAVPLKPGLFT
jgi:hypothetical protein